MLTLSFHYKALSSSFEEHSGFAPLLPTLPKVSRVRRKSCCCELCGELTAFEKKVKDIGSFFESNKQYKKTVESDREMREGEALRRLENKSSKTSKSAAS